MGLEDLIETLEKRVMQEQNSSYERYALTYLYELRARRHDALNEMTKATKIFDMEREFYE